MSGCGCGGGGCQACDDAAGMAIGAPARFAQPVLLGAMLEAIGQETALDGLSTRDTDDPAIALADGYASALAVLGFAAARLSEDGALATSQDRGALIELTRLIGYMPRPALSSSTIIALDGDTTPGAQAQVTAPAGTQIATLAKNGKLPLTFETDAPLLVRADWNALIAVRTVQAPPIEKDIASLIVDGVDVRAVPGDTLVTAAKEGWLVARIAAVKRDLLTAPPLAAGVTDPAAARPRTTLSLVGGRIVKEVKGPSHGSVAILSRRATPFGSSAPDGRAVLTARDLAEDAGRVDQVGEWIGLSLNEDGSIDLEGVVAEALPGRTILFSGMDGQRLGIIKTVKDGHRTGFNLSLPVTHITSDVKLETGSGDKSSPAARVRSLSILIETERLNLLALPIAGEKLPADAHPDRLEVLGIAARDLPAGRAVALSGLDAGGVPLVEQAQVLVTGAAADPANTVIIFAKPVVGRFVADGLVVRGNIVGATEGKTIANPPELLGSSSATDDRPVYPLAATPVAHVPAENARGYAPALAVRVDGRLYQRADRLLDLADDRAWQLRPRRNGRFEIAFAGRLPSAANSVTALYRVGGGAEGNVDVGAISMVMTPIVGLSRATNLVRSEGGSNAETPDAMRRAGETVTVLDRVVALADYERFARRFRGVGRASAVELRVAMRREIVLTLASNDPAAPQPGAALCDALKTAILAAAGPGRPPRILGFDEVAVAAKIAFSQDPALERALVEAAVRAALVANFGPDARGFGESLWSSQITAVVQAVPGVIASSVTFAGGVDPVPAEGPTSVNGIVIKAQRVALDPVGLILKALSS